MRQNCWFSWQQRWTCQISTVSLWVFACHNDQTCALTMFYHKLRCNEREETCITTKIVFEKDITRKKMIKDAYLTSTRDLGIRQWLTYWFWKRTWTSNNIDIDLVYFFGGGLGCLIPLEDEGNIRKPMVFAIQHFQDSCRMSRKPISGSSNQDRQLFWCKSKASKTP